MSFLDGLPRPFFVLAPMDDVTDTVFRQIIADLPYPERLDGVQGTAEQQSESYTKYGERAAEAVTQQSAKSTSRAAGSASRQAGAARRYGPDMYVTEFVNVDGLQSPGREKLLKKLQFTDREQPLVAQLWGLNPDNFYKTIKELRDGTILGEIEQLRAKGRDAAQGNGGARSESYGAVRRVSTRASDTAVRCERGGMAGVARQQASAALSYAGVDLNMGCPVKTVIKNGACAALINNRELAGEIIDASREAAGKQFPFSVKTRVGFNTTDMSWIEFLLQKKLDLLSIHGRTAKQLSKVPPNWDAIGQAREMRDLLCPSTLVVGNGDVMSRQQGLELAKKHKLDGIMVGRGIFEDPFLFAEESPWESFTKEQKLELYRKHIELFAKTWLKGEYRYDSLKKFCKVYISDFVGAAELRAELMASESPKEALAIIADND